MKKSLRTIIATMAAAACVAANADDAGRLYIIGEATPGGWSLDMAQALLDHSEPTNEYSGTIYLNNEGDFKFMTNHEWGSEEYGLPTGAAATVDGQFALASGTGDTGYEKMKVAEPGNYSITIDTENMTATITRSPYQDSEIKYCSLYLVGDATPNGWSIDNGTPLYQSQTRPYVYENTVTLKSSGSFKIVNAIRGGGSWNAEYFYFRDANDDGKISTDGTDDRQWSVAKDGDYTVKVNTADNTIALSSSSAAVEITTAPETLTPVYYNLQGQRVINPDKGMYIKVTGNKSEKIMMR